MEGPKSKQSGSSNSSDLSLPPPPTTHELDRSPPKRPPGYNPPPPIGENTVRQQNNKHIQFQTQSTEQTSPPRRQSGNVLPQEGIRTTVASAATGFQAIEAHPVSQAGPVIGPYVQRAQTLATETQPVTCIPKPQETLASWRATNEEMTHVIPTNSTATSLSATFGLATLGPVSRSQSVAPSQSTAKLAHSEGMQIPQVPVRSGSSLSAPGEISISAVQVNPQVSLRESTHQSRQKVQQDTTQFKYQTDQRSNYLAVSYTHLTLPTNREV